jgi:hypothetical protein
MLRLCAPALLALLVRLAAAHGPGQPSGHASAGGAFPADVDFLNRETAQLLDVVTGGGRRLR